MTYNARLDVDNKELLLSPGMTATVSVVTREAKGVRHRADGRLPLQPAAAARARSFSLRDLFMPRMRWAVPAASGRRPARMAAHALRAEERRAAGGAGEDRRDRRRDHRDRLRHRRGRSNSPRTPSTPSPTSRWR